MKVVVTGASGLLGRAVLAAFTQAGHDVRGTAFSRAEGDLVKLDLQDEQAVRAFLGEFAPEVVVHCAAERRPDAVEQNPEAANHLNVLVPSLLSSLSLGSTTSTSRRVSFQVFLLNPFFLIYISTDYVFNGNAPQPDGYEPLDDPAPTNAYGESKLRGEDRVLVGLKDGGKGCVLRVPVLYGEAESHSESAINTLVDSTRKAASGSSVKMDNWATRYPTYVGDIARVLVELADKSQNQQIPAVLHFSAQQLFTKYTICQLFARLHNPPLDLCSGGLVSVDVGPGPGETIRPRDCHLSNREIENLGINTKTVDFESWWKQYLSKA
ncbi:hypothetical protein JCM11251_001552 [Rhodosporidiobolus azoricus]